MHGDLQATRKFLAELREEFLRLPSHARADVISVLGALAETAASPRRAQSQSSLKAQAS